MFIVLGLFDHRSELFDTHNISSMDRVKMKIIEFNVDFPEKKFLTLKSIYVIFGRGP